MNKAAKGIIDYVSLPNKNDVLARGRIDPQSDEISPYRLSRMPEEHVPIEDADADLFIDWRKGNFPRDMTDEIEENYKEIRKAKIT